MSSKFEKKKKNFFREFMDCNRIMSFVSLSCLARQMSANSEEFE